MISLMAGVSAPLAAEQDVRQFSQHAEESTLEVNTTTYGVLTTAPYIPQPVRTILQ